MNTTGSSEHKTIDSGFIMIPTLPDPQEQSPESDSEESSEGGFESKDDFGNPNQYGFIPLYRTFRDEWFWKETPWDVAHLLMELLMRANRKDRQTKHGGKIHTIKRGQMTTSKVKLAEDSGRDRKTISRWLKSLEESGHLTTQSIGQSGIIVTISKYESYARDQKGRGSVRGSPAHKGQDSTMASL